MRSLLPRVLFVAASGLAVPAWGGADPSTVRCDTACLSPGAIVGTAGPDRLMGTRGDDILCGLEGDDRIKGRGGDDILCGGDGNDTMLGGVGTDHLDGGDGDDVLRGGRGDDALLGGDDEDRVHGGKGDDCSDGGDGDDRIRGGAGTDTCVGDQNARTCETATGICAAEAQSAASIYSFANGCVSLRVAGGLHLTRGGAGFAFDQANGANATPIFMKPSRLGSYLLYDDAEGFVVSDGADLLRATELLSDVLLVDDGFESDAEWDVLASNHGLFRLRHRKSGAYLSADGLVMDTTVAATALVLQQRDGCAEFPEERTHASGEVQRVEFDDGDLFGFADVHTHIFQNFAFGGGGIIHGAPYHPLGVRHALPDCERYHGPDGRADLAGFAFDNSGAAVDVAALLPALLSGQLEEFNHATKGYPDFTDWPAFNRSTHQTQYYKWLERAHLAGMRLVVQLASGNQILCDLFGGSGIQPLRYSCNDMVSVDRQVREVYEMQDYVDAQAGGPGEGWFRIATSSAQARDIIRSGKMAVVLGIEISNLFDCFLSPPTGFARCTEQDVLVRLDEYYDRGVRVLFPVHKYDNAFSAGDGQKGIIELGNILQTGHFSSFTQDCLAPVQGGGFDDGAALGFPGANMPRADFHAEAPFDFSRFFEDLLGTLAPIAPNILEPPTGEPGFCQRHGMTALGEFLMREMMRRGMIPDLAHLPRRSYSRAYEMLGDNDYPASDTHGRDNDGQLFTLGGISQAWFDRCRTPGVPATTDDFFQDKLQRVIENGGYPAVPFGFDLNGFAGAQAPRFGPRGCATEQSDPITYPFTSFAGDVTFHEPMVGNRVIDFNTEGFVHIGLVAEMIQDVRADGVTDAELEPLFRSAEAYVRMWEKAERRSAEIRATE